MPVRNVYRHCQRSPGKQNHSQLRTSSLYRQGHKFLKSWILKFQETLKGSFETPFNRLTCAWEDALHLKQSLSEDAIYICSKQKDGEGQSAVQYYKVECIRHMIVWFRWIFIAFLFIWIFIMLHFYFIPQCYSACYFFNWNIML